MNTRIGESDLVLCSQPHADLIIANEAARLFEFVLQGRQGGVRHAPVDGGRRDMIAECVVYSALGVGIQPRRYAVAVHAEQRGNVLAVPGLATCHQIQRVESLGSVPICNG